MITAIILSFCTLNQANEIEFMLRDYWTVPEPGRTIVKEALAMLEYERLMAFYQQYGYQVVEVPNDELLLWFTKVL